MNSKSSAFPYWDESQVSIGLTKREYIATKALQGLLSNETVISMEMSKVVDNVLEITDTLLKRLDKPQ